MLKDLAKRCRSYRRFYQDRPIAVETLTELVELARLSASGGNRQVLKYGLANSPELNGRVFAALGWAGYLPEWDGPEEGERPAAYVVLLRDTSLGAGMPQDEGIAVQSIVLGATELGLGGCIFANIRRQALAEAIGLDAKYEIALIVALGYPKEEVVVEPMDAAGSVKYWRDDAQVHHVPKRSLSELLVAL